MSVYFYVDKYFYAHECFKPLGKMTCDKINLFFVPCQVNIFDILNNEK